MSTKKLNKPNEVNNIISMKKKDDIVLSNKKDRNVLGSFYFEDISDTKAIKYFIKKIESQIRSSKEYKEYIRHLCQDIGINHCAVFGNISDSDEVTLEFHHYPFTLYDIVEICVNRRLMKGEKICSMDIIDEVLKLHERNEVGLVKLCKTAHELVHAGKIFIKLESIFGKVNDFIDYYQDYIPEDIIENYNKLIDMNEIDFNEYILSVKKEALQIETNIPEEELKLLSIDEEVIHF